MSPIVHAEAVSPEWTLAAAGEFEPTPTFKASEIIEPEMISGDNFRVREEVGSDGYWDIYTVDTKFGVFIAHGWMDLRNLIREIDAIAHLDGLSKTLVFIEGAVERGLEPIDLAASIIQHPVQTISNLPRGIGQMFNRFAEQAKLLLTIMGIGDDKADLDTRLAEACARGDELTPGVCDKEGYGDEVNDFAEKYFDVDEARRQWHEELGTDPYSTNKVLQDAITEFSWFDGMGRYGFRFTGLHRSDVIRITNKVYRLAWRKDPANLQKYIAQELQSLKMSDEQTKYFMGNPYISPTRQIFIIESLKDMGGVEGGELVLQWTANALSEDEALYMATTVALLAWFHTQSPLKSFLPNTLIPIVQTVDRRNVALLPVDELSWTEDVAHIMNYAMRREDKERIQNEEAWLLGRASARARAELEARDWIVVEDGSEIVLKSGEDLELETEAET